MNCLGLVCVWYAMGSPWATVDMIRHFSTPPAPELAWHTDYAEATTRARLGRRPLLVHFVPSGNDAPGDAGRRAFESITLADPGVRARLDQFVLVRLAVDAEIQVRGQRVVVLQHPAFREMLGRPGLAIIDYRTRQSDLYGRVVSSFPFTPGHYYRPEAVRVILELPEGTLTQRTLIFAVRTHPDAPQSTEGQLHPVLADEAFHHSQHQADIRLQGHHSWETRFHRINARLSEGAASQEVCAESWPGETLVEAAVECVRCWRLSPGHWSAVRARHAVFGYDMRRGHNGVWYATGIFANFRR